MPTIPSAGHLEKQWGVGFGERRTGPEVPCSTGWDFCELCFPYCSPCIRGTEKSVKACKDKKAADGETNDDKDSDDGTGVTFANFDAEGGGGGEDDAADSGGENDAADSGDNDAEDFAGFGDPDNESSDDDDM